MDEGTRQLLQIFIASVITGVLTFIAREIRTQPRLVAAKQEARRESKAETTSQTNALETKLSADIERKYLDLLERFEQTARRLDEEFAKREAAEARIAALQEERDLDRAKYAHAIGELGERLDGQRVQIDSLMATVGQLEKERDTLRGERDQAIRDNQALTTKQETTADRLTKAEAEIRSMSIKNEAFELIWNRFNIQIVPNHVEGKPE